MWRRNDTKPRRNAGIHQIAVSFDCVCDRRIKLKVRTRRIVAACRQQRKPKWPKSTPYSQAHRSAFEGIIDTLDSVFHSHLCKLLIDSFNKYLGLTHSCLCATRFMLHLCSIWFALTQNCFEDKHLKSIHTTHSQT